jgi:hypothetical protein
VKFDQFGNLVLTMPPTSAAGLIPLVFMLMGLSYVFGYARGGRR